MAKNNIKKTVYYLAQVEYSGKAKDYVDAFGKKKTEDKSGCQWEVKGDKDLIALKKVIKKHYLKAQDFRCAYCRQKVVVKHNAAWDTEHILCKDQYPQFMFEPKNLCVSCKDCNNIKRAKNVLTNKGRTTFPDAPDDYIICHPHLHNYADHIRVIREAVLYLPISKEGRQLIEICGLLRFVFDFAGYQIESIEIGQTIIELASQLQKSTNSLEKVAIMSIMKTLLEQRITSDLVPISKGYLSTSA